MKKIIFILLIFLLNIHPVNADPYIPESIKDLIEQAKENAENINTNNCNPPANCYTQEAARSRFEKSIDRRWKGHKDDFYSFGSNDANNCFSASSSNTDILVVSGFSYSPRGRGSASINVTAEKRCMCNCKTYTFSIPADFSEWGLASLKIKEKNELNPIFHAQSGAMKKYPSTKTITVPYQDKTLTLEAVANENNPRENLANIKITKNGKKISSGKGTLTTKVDIDVDKNVFVINVDTGLRSTDYTLTIIREKAIATTNIYFKNKVVEYDIGQSFYIAPVIEPANAETSEYVWTSSNESIATVDNNGKVKPKKVGNTTITVTTPEGLTASVLVKIVKKVQSIKTKNPVMFMKLNETKKLEYDIYPNDATNKNVIFSSDNPDIADIDENGNITSYNYGRAIVWVTSKDGEKKSSTVIRVTPDGVGVDSNVDDLCKNQTLIGLIEILRNIVQLLEFATIILLIAIGIRDMFKAMSSKDEEAIKTSQKLFFKRIIYAVLVFFVFTIVVLVMNLIREKEWQECWGIEEYPDINSNE